MKIWNDKRDINKYRLISVLVSLITILLLCNDVNASQAKTDSRAKPDASTSVEEHQNPTKESPKPHQEQAKVENKEVVRDENTPMIERISKLAQKTNWALFISFLATLIAFLSWLANIKSVNITKDNLGVSQDTFKLTRRANFDEFRPYISMSDAVFTIYEKHPEQIIISCTFKNIGKTPARKVRIKAQVFEINGAIENFKIRFDASPEHRKQRATFLPNQESKIKLSHSTPQGGALIFAGIILYRDQAGQIRRTIFKRILLLADKEMMVDSLGNRMMRGPLSLMVGGNRAS